jgi:hypothetical protein
LLSFMMSPEPFDPPPSHPLTPFGPFGRPEPKVTGAEPETPRIDDDDDYDMPCTD